MSIASELGYAVGSIEDTNLAYLGDDCLVYILDGGNFELGFTGSISRAANGKVFTQIFSETSINFGLEISNVPMPVLIEFLDKLRTKLLSSQTFVVNIHDFRTVINHNCTWDFGAQPFGPTFPKQLSDTTYLKEYVMRLVAVSPVEGS